MIRLFPPINTTIKSINGKNMIFDPIRKKFLVLTPEEWVRQHLIVFLIEQFNFPKNRIAQETKIIYEGKQKKRTDVLVVNQDGKPVLIVECKRPEVKLDQNVLDQAFRYNKVLDLPYVFITNGIEMFGFKVNGGNFEKLISFPDYSELSALV